ncbi:MAG: Probable sigma-54 interacting response regulator transcription regulator protein, partial [uncultured Ramlibacter sp.]
GPCLDSRGRRRCRTDDGAAGRQRGLLGGHRAVAAGGASADGDAAAGRGAARLAPARRQRHGAARRLGPDWQLRGGADDRARHLGDIDPGPALRRRRLPDQTRQPQAAAEHPVAGDEALGAEGRGAHAARRPAAHRPIRPPGGHVGSDGSGVRADRARRRHLGDGVHHRRERHRQGAGGTHGARPEPPPGQAVPRGELRRDLTEPDRERDLRPREGQLHGRRAPAPGLLRAGARRHAVPRRDHRDAAGAAGQAAAGAGDRHLHAGRIHHAAGDRRARGGRGQPRSGPGGGAGALPRGPALSPERLPAGAAALARAAGGPAPAGQALPAGNRPARRDGQARHAGRPGPPGAVPLARQRPGVAQRAAARLRDVGRPRDHRPVAAAGHGSRGRRAGCAAPGAGACPGCGRRRDRRWRCAHRGDGGHPAGRRGAAGDPGH